MAVRKVLKIGVPTLCALSQSVDINKCAKLDELIQDMIDTMREYDGVGISAPQIGINKRVIVFGFDFCPRYPNEKTVSGFHARIVQHECDHLEGILFPERIENMKNFGFENSLSI